MKMNSAAFTLLVCFVFSVSTLVGQRWTLLPRVTYGANNLEEVGTSCTSRVTYDSVHHEFWAGHDSRIIVSRDNGLSWSEPSQPFTPSPYNLGVIVASGAGRIIGSWANSYKRRLFFEFDRSNDSWESIYTSSRSIPYAVIDSAAFINLYTGLCPYSHARDRIWRQANLDSPYSSDNYDVGYDPSILQAHPTIMSIKNGGNWIEFSTVDGKISTSLISPTITHYCYSAQKNIIVAGIRVLQFSPTKYDEKRRVERYSIGVSNDSGKIFIGYDTIRFVNSKKIITNTEVDSTAFMLSTIRLHGKSITVVLADGRVFSTDDGGKTFWYRGVGEFSTSKTGAIHYSRQSYISTISDSVGNLFYSRNGQIFMVPKEIEQPLILFAKGKMINSISVGNGMMIATGFNYLVRSTNGGTTWILTGSITTPKEHDDFLPIPQKYMIFNRIVARDTDDIAVLSFTRGIQARYRGYEVGYELDGWKNLIYGSRKLTRFGEDYMDEHNSDITTTRNYEVVTFNSDSVQTLNRGIVHFLSDSISPLISGVSPEPYYPIRFYQQHESEIFCQINVLWHSTDGATWQEIGKGLPADSNGRQGTIASILRLRDGRLLCGMKGYTVFTQREFGTDNYDTSYVKGGLWVSSDNGQNWQELSHPAVTGSNVWFLKRKGDLNEQRLATAVDGGTDTLVASVGTVETKRVLDEIHEIGPDGNPRFTGFYDTISVTTMRDARIVTSTDGGVSWRVTYNEPKSRPGFSPRREIISRRDGSLLAATVESGVLWSPNGLVWTPLGNDTLNQTVILDIDVDTNDVVYAATDKGIFYINDRPTSVDDGKLNIPSKNSRFFSMWTYPAPVRTQVQVRLNNVEALSNTIRSLKLYNIYGTEVADYSTAIPQQSAGRAEFTLSLPAHIASGVYLLALDTGAGIVSSKLFVAE